MSVNNHRHGRWHRKVSGALEISYFSFYKIERMNFASSHRAAYGHVRVIAVDYIGDDDIARVSRSSGDFIWVNTFSAKPKCHRGVDSRRRCSCRVYFPIKCCYTPRCDKIAFFLVINLLNSPLRCIRRARLQFFFPWQRTDPDSPALSSLVCRALVALARLCAVYFTDNRYFDGARSNETSARRPISAAHIEKYYTTVERNVIAWFFFYVE